MRQKKPTVGIKRKDKTMTVKEAMTRVCDNAAVFPLGWNTQVAEVIRKAGGECYERRQRKVWMLTIKEPGAEVGHAVSVYRTLEKAKAAMEEDIREEFATRFQNLNPTEELARTDELHVQFWARGITWEITHEPLWA